MKFFCIVALAGFAHWLMQQALLGLAHVVAFGRFLLESVVGFGGASVLPQLSLERRLALALNFLNNPARSLPLPDSVWDHSLASGLLLALNSLFWGACFAAFVWAVANTARRYGFLPAGHDGQGVLRFGWLRIHNLLLKHEALVPVLALAFASAVSVALVFARILWTENLRYTFLLWNLFLAWLPLLLALLVCELHRNGQTRNWRLAGLTGVWLLFFPNAPYIFTDLIHLTTRFRPHFWVDLMLILICALTGLVLGFLSLYLMQSVVTRSFGRVAGWLFIAMVAGLSSVGVYLGRFVRVNSWDVVARPGKLFQGITDWVSDPFAHSTSFAFPVLFAIFLFIAYVLLYALTHLQQPQPLSPTLKQTPET
ncbi:MAG: DUF1361 domain-containing protein [Verrucomicrobia bacterium]|nr:DUF1361 domain-containing protein [Verrucomicrobiota bacterium]